jgi:hypothetical protein
MTAKRPVCMLKPLARRMWRHLSGATSPRAYPGAESERGERITRLGVTDSPNRRISGLMQRKWGSGLWTLSVVGDRLILGVESAEDYLYVGGGGGERTNGGVV